MYRLGRIREQLRRFDYAGVLLYDQLNSRYATDATNMQVWCSHNEARYTFVPTQGPVVMFEYGPHRHLSEGLPGVDEVRPTTSWYYFAAGPRFREKVKLWAAEIADLVRQHGGGNRRVAADRMGVEGVGALQSEGIEVLDAWELMETAREIKSADEIVLMRKAVDVCEQAMTDMRLRSRKTHCGHSCMRPISGLAANGSKHVCYVLAHAPIPGSGSPACGPSRLVRS